MIDLHADQCGYPPLEDAILDIQKDLVAQGHLQYQSEQIIKLQLPWNCVPELLALLWLEFYNIAKMQPTLDRSAQALKDHRDLFL